MIYETAFTDKIHNELCNFLLEPIRKGKLQEKLCFAFWYPSHGSNKLSALISDFIHPEEKEYTLHGNVSFEASYLVRAIQICRKKKAGLVFIHNHLSEGWQGMSRPDIIAEKDRIAPASNTTGLPLVGLTLGTDGQWSARFWIKKNNNYNRIWCDKIRIVGEKLDVQYNEEKIKKTTRKKQLQRTIDTWGIDCQNKMARLTVGIVGLGSVGTVVAESLARMGIQNLILIDGDKIKIHNLDRLLYATEKDIGQYKVLLAEKYLKKSATASNFNVKAHTSYLQNETCYKSALDCDILFSCVDRPLPKDILNNIAYVHYIPVIFGGIFIDTKIDSKLAQAIWSVSVLSPKFQCLRCDKQYTTSDVIQEVDGSFDDPSYMRQESGLSNQNVFPFSTNLASAMVLEMIRFIISEDWWSHVGKKTRYNLIAKNIKISSDKKCEENCVVFLRSGIGDNYKQNFLTQTSLDSRLSLLFSSIISWIRKLFKKIEELF